MRTRGSIRSPRFPRSHSLASLLVLLAAMLSAESALGQSNRTPERDVAISHSSRALLATVSFPDLFTDTTRARLDSGFWTTVVTRVAVQRVGQDSPVSLALRTCRVRYELWEEHYEVEVRDHTGQTSSIAETQEAAIAACTTLADFPIADRDAITTGRFYVVIATELNPVSEELLDSIRRWLRNPQGGHQRIDRGNSFFGSAVSLFVNNRIGRSDRSHRFRSQVFGP